MTMMLAMLSPAIQAATAATDDTDNKVKFSPVGTLVMDGALFASPQKSDFPDGAAIPDVRLGVMADMGKWSAKIEASPTRSASASRCSISAIRTPRPPA